MRLTNISYDADDLPEPQDLTQEEMSEPEAVANELDEIPLILQKKQTLYVFGKVFYIAQCRLVFRQGRLRRYSTQQEN